MIFELFLASAFLLGDISPSATDTQSALLFNEELADLKQQLQKKFYEVQSLVGEEREEHRFALLLEEVKEIHRQIKRLEEAWRIRAAKEGASAEEPYGIWDLGETTLSQLMMEFGGTDSLYAIPQELAGMKISLFTSIPIPRESWSEMIEAILAHNGVGVKRVNPYVKQLYILKLDPSAIEGIVDREEKLGLFAPNARIFYVFSPPPEQLRGLQSFFERFSDPKQTTIHSIGSKVVVVSNRETIEKLIGLQRAVWDRSSGKVVRIVQLSRVQAAEAEKVLKAVFSEGGKGRPTFYPPGADELVTLVLPQGLVLIGEAEGVERGEELLHQLESQLEDPSEKIIFWYQCKHSNPEDIAKVLDQVYDSLVGSTVEKGPPPPPAPQPIPPVAPQEPNGAQIFPPPGNAYNPVLPATAGFVQPGTIDKTDKKIDFGNFIVDSKTTSILMVVRRADLPKIKSLLRHLDVPKRMVQLDVMLVEKKLHDRMQSGINVLQIGANASGKKETSVNFDTSLRGLNKGILSFIYSKNSGAAPAMDFVYHFLLAQEDVRINANPSVLAVNQTAATVSLVEEISINNGAIQLNTQAGVTVEQSYTRAQFGITIVLTPTIHLPDPDDTESDEHPGFVSLQTNLEFDTTQFTPNDRPPVTRRHVENQVVVADGETIILGGLRRKIEEDTKEKIPFLGDIPGIGKFFSFTKSTDTNTEMFIFITPKIVRDPIDDLRKIRQDEYRKRAGDIPEFLERIDEAKQKERRKLFRQSFKLLFETG